MAQITLEKAVITEIYATPKKPGRLYLTLHDVDGGKFKFMTEAIAYNDALQIKLQPVRIVGTIKGGEYNGNQTLELGQVSITPPGKTAA